MSKVTETWLSDPASIKGILVEVVASIYDFVNVQWVETTLYLSNIGYLTTDNLTIFNPIIVGGLQVTESISLEGSISMSFGDIGLSNPNGELDNWLDASKYIWTNRPVKVYVGDPGWVCANLAQIRTDFELVFTGLVSDIDASSREQVNLKIRDSLERLNTPITENKVGTYGTWSGGQTNQDTLKPVVLGEAFNITPLLIDPSQLEYMYSDPKLLGSGTNVGAERVTEIRDNGVPIYNVNINTGATVNLASGTFKLTKTPVGVVTASIQGVPYTLDLSTRTTVINYATSQGWVPGNTNQPGSFGGDFFINGTDSENLVAYGTNPFGLKSLLWTARNNDTASNDDGGWNKPITGLSSAKNYMSVVYVKRNGTNTNGIFYHGCGYSGVTLDLNKQVVDNPYFGQANISALPQDVWCVSIGFINSNTNTATTSSANSGLYRLDTGQKILIYTDFKMANTATTQVHRTYLYFSTDSAASLDWWEPGFYEINGSEPSISNLVKNISYKWSLSYKNTVTNIIALICTNYGKPSTRLQLSELDLDNLLAFDSANPIPIGYALSARENVLTVCQNILSSLGSQLYITKKGLLQILTLGVPTTDTIVNITDADIIQHSLSVSNKLPVAPSTSLGYARNWTVQANLTSNIPDAHKATFAQEWLSTTVTDTATKTLYSLTADPVQKDTSLITAISAYTESTRLTNYYKTARTVYKFTGTARLFVLKLGQQVTLTHSRFNLNAGKSGQVVSLSYDWIAGTVNVEVLV